MLTVIVGNGALTEDDILNTRSLISAGAKLAVVNRLKFFDIEPDYIFAQDPDVIIKNYSAMVESKAVKVTRYWKVVNSDYGNWFTPYKPIPLTGHMAIKYFTDRKKDGDVLVLVGFTHADLKKSIYRDNVYMDKIQADIDRHGDVYNVGTCGFKTKGAWI